jgi:hypothetical protein
MLSKITVSAAVLMLVTLTVKLLGAGQQPVEFNHNLHINDVGMDCTECHLYVMQERKATLPDKEVCLECHSEPQGETSKEAAFIDLLQSDMELKWQRVYVLPKHVYFSHFRHVTLGQLPCQGCHGDMQNLTSPPTKRAVNIIDMDYCIDCHEESQASVDCLSCHY